MRRLTIITAVAALATLMALADPPQAGLSLIDALSHCLERNPTILNHHIQVTISQSSYRQQRGAFNGAWNVQAGQDRVNTPLTASQERGVPAGMRAVTTNLSSISGGWQQTLRNGISFGPSIDIDRTTDNLLTVHGLNKSQVSFQVVVPLIRGRGRDVVTTNERASLMEVDATVLDGNQIVSAVLGDAAATYWNLVATTEIFEVARQSEERGFAYMDHVKTLIDAGQSPRSDIYNVAANLAERRSSRIAAMQSVMEARQRLMLSMGYLAAELNLGVEPADRLPNPGERLPATDAGAVDQYLEIAVTRRGDLLAAEKRIQEARTVAHGAENLTKPVLNLVLQSGYSGLREGLRADSLFVSPLVGIRGLDMVGGFQYSFAPANDVALGRQAQAKAVVQQAELHSLDLKRQIASAIVVSLEALRNATLRLRASNESVASASAALEGQREKLRLGQGSLIDLLTVEDRLTSALLNNVQARVAYPVALTQFRLATGTLIEAGSTTHTIDQGTFTTLPEKFLFAER